MRKGLSWFEIMVPTILIGAIVLYWAYGHLKAYIG